MRRLKTLNAFSNRAQKQSGAILAICLIFLLLVTILGVSIIETSTVQEKMAANTRDKDLAFQAAELALKAAEHYLETNDLDRTAFTASCTDGLCAAPTAAEVVARWKNPNTCGQNQDIWSCEKSRAVGAGWQVATDLHVRQPRFFIEILADLSTADGLNLGNIGDAVLGQESTVYRITAIGYGGSASSRSVLQATYAK